MDENAYLAELSKKPLISRIGGYFRLSGPGYMQSAMTLGAGSMASCVVLGSLLGYKLLWVQPMAIVLGVFLLGAVAKQTCHTGERTYEVFWKRLHPALALLWAACAMVATVIWHFPQYSLAADGMGTLAGGLGVSLGSTGARAGIGAVLLIAATAVVALYVSGARGLKAYETAIKILVWSIVIAFTVAAFATGFQFKQFLLGITGISFLQDVLAGGYDPRATKPIVGGIAAAVGINMLFLYPYSLLNKNWGKNHKELAYYDLITGMLIPFLFTTTFVTAAVANTLGPAPGEVADAPVREIVDVIPALSQTFGEGFSRILIGFGMLAIGFSTIITHMLACGFIGCEIFGFDNRGKAKFWFSLVPAIGVLGVGMKSPWLVAITASSLAAPLMPISVLCFLLLMNNRDYMGDATPRGGKKLMWNVMLSASIIVLSIAGYFGLAKNWEDLKSRLSEPPAETALLVEAESTYE
ncbi:MAG: hypothetical protein AMXMBFR82_36460 [Candidatus Hydrogenedentota bacterium]